MIYGMEFKVSDYWKLITSEHKTRSKFKEYVEAIQTPIVESLNFYQNLNEAFNLESAEGKQLDIIGELVGTCRELPTTNPIIGERLSDYYFRLVIKSKIAMNRWDGTREQLKLLMTQIFPGALCEVIDFQDMSMWLVVISPEIDHVILELFKEGFLTPRPAAVKISIKSSFGKLFGYDLENQYIAGYDKGIWA
jgi:hypothetical protein